MSFKAVQRTSGSLGIMHLNKVPMAPLSWRIKNWLTWQFIGGWLAVKAAILFSAITHIQTHHSALSLMKGYVDKAGNFVPTVKLGIVSYRVITTAWAEFFVDQLQTESSVIGDLKFHDSGVGVTGAAVGDTDMETTDGESRATGSQEEDSSVAYKSIGTITYTSTKAITEWGVFTASSGAVLADRHTFSAVNVVNTESIQGTYVYTVSTGG